MKYLLALLAIALSGCSDVPPAKTEQPLFTFVGGATSHHCPASTVEFDDKTPVLKC